MAPAFTPQALEPHAAELVALAERHVARWPRRRPFRLLPRMKTLADDVFVPRGARRARRGAGDGAGPGHPPFAPAGQEGRPRIFVSHGTHDRVLPIDRCSRRLVPALRSAGYDVTYEEFDGGHDVPPALAQQAVTWLDKP